MLRSLCFRPVASFLIVSTSYLLSSNSRGISATLGISFILFVCANGLLDPFPHSLCFPELGYFDLGL